MPFNNKWENILTIVVLIAISSTSADTFYVTKDSMFLGISIFAGFLVVLLIAQMAINKINDGGK